MARPREFDPGDALERAMHQFWAKGYCSTSIRDLVDCTGVNYYGLYGVFDSKRGLFLSALDHYQKTVTAEILGEFDKPGPIKKTIIKGLQYVQSVMRKPEGALGCLMCNTALEVAPYDSEVSKKVEKHMSAIQQAIGDRLLSAQTAGELAVDQDIVASAEYLTASIYSIGMLVRAGRDEAFVNRYIKNTANILA